MVNYDYISNVLCVNKDKVELKCNGKCHLNEQIEKAFNAQNSTEKNAEIPITINDFHPAIIDYYSLNSLSPIVEFLGSTIFKSKRYSKDVYGRIFHPPESALSLHGKLVV